MLATAPIRKATAKNTVPVRIVNDGYTADGIQQYHVKSRTGGPTYYQQIDTCSGEVQCDCPHGINSAVLKELGRMGVTVTAAFFETVCHHCQRAIGEAVRAERINDATPAMIADARHAVVEARRRIAERRAVFSVAENRAAWATWPGPVDTAPAVHPDHEDVRGTPCEREWRPVSGSEWDRPFRHDREEEL